MKDEAAPGLVFRQEGAAEVLGEATELAATHWREVEAELHGGAEYKLDGERYAALERLGMLSITTARDPEGRLAGYAVLTLAPCPHLQGETVAALDGLYLAPEFRRGLNALALLRSAEAAVAARGAALVQYSSPASRPCGALYRRLGATHTETIWHKRLVKAGGTAWQ
ncbi:MAG: GNAT family N-acetyltransferase [Desulfovibrio sp.]|uniref:GNAT family N-acetyltransferase n=1 Tax=Desulfovibrio sp. TaxID=885 RepID=UPI001A683393|nr:GNAT family N-acetyltransferase [Desulfovibrio sp.]MBD5416693.1 GNAT family N-acetyltransferase [Desulfovibrio sp.]